MTTTINDFNFPPAQFSLEMLDNLSIYVFIKDLENKFIWLNKHLENAWGINRNKLIGVNIKDLMPEFSDFNFNDYAKDDNYIINTGLPLSNIIEYFPTKQYGLKCVSTTKLPYVVDNKIIGIIGISMDITDYRQQSLEFEILLDSLSDSFIILDKEGKILKIHYGKIKILKKCQDYIGKNISSFEDKFPGFYDQFKDCVDKMTNDLFQSTKDSYYFEYSSEDKLFECNLDFFNHSKIVITIRDITLRKKMDQLDILLHEANETNSSLLKTILEWK